MAYLHCHNCDWSQDDFWTFRYNPITKFWDKIKWLWKPKFIELDDWLIDDLEKYTKIYVWKFKNSKRCHKKVFSWDWLFLELVKNWRLFREQKWWTWKSWKKKSKTALCPKCKTHNFDID